MAPLGGRTSVSQVSRRGTAIRPSNHCPGPSTPSAQTHRDALDPFTQNVNPWEAISVQNAQGMKTSESRGPFPDAPGSGLVCASVTPEVSEQLSLLPFL